MYFPRGNARILSVIFTHFGSQNAIGSKKSFYLVIYKQFEGQKRGKEKLFCRTIFVFFINF